MKKILLTGAAGFIGSNTATALLDRDDVVVGVDNLNDYYDPARKQANLEEVRKAAPNSDKFIFHKADIRNEAARLQQIESKQLEVLTSVWTKARVRTWCLAEFVESPIEALHEVIDEIGTQQPSHLIEAPKMVDLSGFGQFLQNLKNQGMHPYLMGDFPVDDVFGSQTKPFRKPYLVQ